MSPPLPSIHRSLNVIRGVYRHRRVTFLRLDRALATSHLWRARTRTSDQSIGLAPLRPTEKYSSRRPFLWHVLYKKKKLCNMKYLPLELYAPLVILFQGRKEGSKKQAVIRYYRDILLGGEGRNIFFFFFFPQVQGVR